MSKARCFIIIGVLLILLPAAPVAFAQPAQSVLREIEAGGRMTAIAIGADNQRVAVGATDNILRVLDQAGATVWEFEAENSILGVDMSSDGKWIAVASEDRNVYLLDEAGSSLWQHKAARSMNNAAVADDGSLIAGTANDRSFYVLDGQGNLLWQQDMGIDVEAVDIYGTAEKARVVVGTDGGVVAIYSRDGKLLLETFVDYAVHSLAVTGNGARIEVGMWDGTISLLNGANGNTLWQYASDEEVLAVSMSRRGEMVLAGTEEGNAYLLDRDGLLRQQFSLGEEVLDVALSEDTEVLAFSLANGRSSAVDLKVAEAGFSRAATVQRWTIFGSLAILVVAVLAGSLAVGYTEAGRNLWLNYSAGPRELLHEIWRARLSYLFVIPTVLLLLVFNYYPAISGLYHAFTDWNPGAKTVWVGLKNFEFLSRDRFFWAGFRNGAILVIADIIKVMTVPLLVAELIFHIRNSFAQYWFRTLFVVPVILPMVVKILVWNNIYDPTIGLLNQSLIAVGAEGLTRTWYGDASVALTSIIFIEFPWVNPFALLVFYGGLISISNEILDAAEVDGASALQRFRHVDLPLLFGQVKLLLILTFIAAAQTFELVFLTTAGGPGAATYTPALELYYMATKLDKLGVASAIGIILFIIILAGTIVNIRWQRGADEIA